MNEVSINFGGLIACVSSLTFWGIVLLYIHYKHKRNIKIINKKIEERVNRPLDEHDMMTMQEEVNQYWQTAQSFVRRSAIIPYDEIRPKTDKLSPKKNLLKHKLNNEE